MKTTQLTLHAMPEELLSWVERWMSSGEFRAAILRIAPEFSMVQVASVTELRAEVANRGVPFRVCIGPTNFDISVATLHDFMTKNAMECIVDLGTLSPDGLKESTIVVISDGPERWSFWAGALRAVKATTKAGVWAVSPTTRARKFFKNNRYTSAVAQLAFNGLKLLPIAGWNFFEIEVGTHET